MGQFRDDPRSVLATRLAEVGREQRLSRGEVLFHQGDPAHEIFGFVAGRVRLDRNLADGQVVTVGVARGPSLLAEAALFSDFYRCSATAERAFALFRVPKIVVLELLETDPSFSRDLARSLMSEVRDLRTRLELRNVRPAADRVVQYLRLLQSRGQPVTDRPLSALASELGLTPETLYRVVGRLEREGRLRRDGRRLVFLS